jgi:hypothetical protein
VFALFGQKLLNTRRARHFARYDRRTLEKDSRGDIGGASVADA